VKHCICESPVLLVSAKTTDLDAMIPFVREFYQHFRYPYVEEQKRKVLKSLIADSSLGRALLINQNGKQIGYVLLTFSFSLEFNGPIAFIDELFIEPSGRQQGVGLRVLKQIEALCSGFGIQAVRLESEARNDRATALYARSGYHDHGRHLMTKQLTSDKT
jgi:diamine N-acetyltransferase